MDTTLTLAEARDGLRKKDFSAEDLTRAHLKKMEERRVLNAYITETPEEALAQAKESDARLAKNEARPLEGIPLGIKDLFCTKGVLTTAASRMLKNFIPPYESTVTQKLQDAGAVFLGKTNLDEFAMGSSNLTSAFGPVLNPWKGPKGEDLVPGGSSGGSAAAVAAHLCLAATATDTGGSIRQPAAFTGIVGVKPTYGRCSRYGIVAFASSLDQAGVMARTVQDSAIVLEHMCGYDPRDSTSANVSVPCFEKILGQSVKGLRIGIPKEYENDQADHAVQKLWQQGIQWLKEAGAEIISVSLPHTSYAMATYYVLAPAEASSNLSRYDGVRFGLRESGTSLDDLYINTRTEGFGAEVKRRIMIGTYVLSAGYYDAYYIKAQKVRQLIKQDFDSAFQRVDCLLTPTAPTGAFPLNQTSHDPVAMYLNDIYTIPASLAGLPTLSVPAGLTQEGLPLGLQLIGRSFEEELILKVAHVMEKAAGFQGLKGV